jgi:hypothetical protein
MKLNKITKNSMILSLTFLIVLNILFFNISHINSSKNDQNQTGPENNGPNKAFSEIQIGLTETTTTYQRKTDADIGLNFFPDDLYRRYQIIADLTTHRELYLQFFIQWDTETAPWPTFDAFNNSPLVINFRDNNEALRQLVLNEEVVQVLDVTSSSFRTHSFTFTEFHEDETQVTNKTFWEIEQKIVVKETTAFLLNLFEPFNFDLNEVELGSLTNFKFESEFFVTDENNAFIHEKLQLSAQGSILKANTTTNGYDAEFAFSDFNPEILGNFFRAFADLPQVIEYKVSVPSTQEITGSSVDKRYLNAPYAKENILIIDNNQKYVFTARFISDDLVPVYISFTTAPPELEIWQQFSLSDYLSFAGSGLSQKACVR